MSINKNAFLRYQLLDKCFSNTGRGYTIDDLLNIVNEKLLEEDPLSKGIQLRQLREDIKFMRKESGFNAPICTKPADSGKKMYYFYEDSKFSIINSPINESEAKQLKHAFSMLSRFEGSPGFEWVAAIQLKLKDTFKLKDSEKKVIAFETNLDYEGERFIGQLFNAIINKKVLKINYKPFISEEQLIIFHPYFLKQYNNRWFVFGYNSELEIETWNLALDRILTMVESNEKYIENTIDWEDFFSDIYGVTKPVGVKEEEIELLFSTTTSPYIKTKPLHQSQKNYETTSGLLIKLKVIPNYELEQMILSFGENVAILSPLSLKEKIKNRIFKMYEKNS